jgi:chromosome segregation ATPase
MAVQKFTPAPTEVDLEATAELPLLDYTGAEALGSDTASITDVHVAPALPAGVAELATSLREAEQRLMRKMERVAGLETELSSALRSATELRTQLDQGTELSSRRETALREAEGQVGRNAERIAALEIELANQQRVATELRTQLDQGTELSSRRETALREAEGQVGRNAERIAALEIELANQQRVATELRTQLDKEIATSVRRDTALREGDAHLARNAERITSLEGELKNSLAIGVELRSKLDHTTAESTRRETGLREAGVHLARNVERIAGLEADLKNALAIGVELRAQMDRERAQGATREKALRDGSQALDVQLTALRQEMAVRGAAHDRLTADMGELSRNNERLLEALQTWQGYRGVSEAQMADHDVQLVAIKAQHAALLATVEARNSELQVEIGASRVAAEHRVTALEESLRRAQAAHEEDQALLASQLQLNQVLQGQLDLASTKVGQVEHDLHVAEEHIHRLESESHANAALLGSLQQNIERLARDDTGSRPVLRVVPTLTEAVERVLIREVDGAEVVFTLGKRTTIGRTPDNDIQIDTSFISRHHAVLLSNPDQCVVEDLNSTNGVQVNGKPVNRQALHDGDKVIIGKTEFRYQQRA